MTEAENIETMWRALSPNDADVVAFGKADLPAILNSLRAHGLEVAPVEPSGPMIDAALATNTTWSINMIPKIQAAYRAMIVGEMG